MSRTGGPIAHILVLSLVWMTGVCVSTYAGKTEDDAASNRTLKVAGIMGVPHREGDYKEENYRETVALIRKAAEAGADLACTYEQFLDGYGFDANKVKSMDDPRVDRYEVIGESKYINGLGDLARELGIVIVAGIGIREETQTRNSALVFDRTGALKGVYRKTYNRGQYARWFAPLNESEKEANCPSFDIGTGRIGLKICNDRHFRETSLYLIKHESELLLCPSYGSYKASRLVDDSADFGLWAVFVHPEGCQFINDGKIVYEQKALEGKGSFAIHEVQLRKPDLSGLSKAE